MAALTSTVHAPPPSQVPEATLRAPRGPLTGADQLHEAEAIVARMAQRRRRINDMLGQAQRVNDTVRVTCLGDKLQQLDVVMESAREHRALLLAAVEETLETARGHEFLFLTILRARSENLESEAYACIGEEIGTFAPGHSLPWPPPLFPPECHAPDWLWEVAVCPER